LVYRDADGGDRNLAEHLGDGSAEPLPTVVRQGKASHCLELELPFEERTHHDDDAVQLVDKFESEHSITMPAADALRWILKRGEKGLDLRGHKYVLLGAGAELAPTPLMLGAGADVLWIDVADPKIDPEQYSGTLRYVEGGADLLTQPKEIVATIEAFADGDPISIGMFAYAAGQGREWRLEAAMNAITNALPRDRVKAVGLYISPTSAARVCRADVTESERRRAVAPVWQKLLARTGALGLPYAQSGDEHVSRAIVPVQGASYQAAQYIAKSMVAEAFSTSRRIETVSANVAGITNTGSMGLPVFQAGFVGAKLFGVRIFEAATTRWLSGLLLLHDWLNTEATSAGPASLFERQIHGGVYSLAYALDDAIRYAALYGFARRPSLMAAMARRR
jgi:hypothetical protein